MILALGDPNAEISASMLPAEVGALVPAVPSGIGGEKLLSLPLREAREAFERDYLVAQISRFGGNISRTAEFIGMERSALHRKLKSLGRRIAGAARPRIASTKVNAGRLNIVLSVDEFARLIFCGMKSEEPRVIEGAGDDRTTLAEKAQRTETRMATEKAQNLQDTFLNHVRKSKTSVTIFLVNGVKLQGFVTWFDNFCVLLRRDGHSQLVYKHAISTIMPASPITMFEAVDEEPR